MKRYTGTIPAAYTPCLPNGDLDLAPIPAMARMFAEQKCPAAFVCGSTGESHSFTTDERKAVAAAWKKHAPAGLDVIVHVGHNCQREAMALAAHAKEIGAAAVSALAPSYFKPATPKDLVDFLRPIAAAAGTLPFYFYDIPSMTNVVFPADRVMKLAAEAIPNFVGLKYTSSDLMRLQSCLAFEGGKYEVLFGTDEILLATLALGIKGGVGSTYNYASPVYRRIYDAVARGDHDTARREQLKTVRLVEVLLEHGVLRTGKAIMSLIGHDCGPIRPPFAPVGKEELAEIRRKLAPLDIFVSPIS
ncbi:dihydrodipicolinate synthase family protein [Humisphaera borealis]|uniref:Dihydrodipicolinate synthase family protein n=1 Tax=Humisphaera borealis TaxID=2807512 RepID=A0A7M2WUA9_9BACT|nr:dihydrodipicolinate synthase family protein [Humisphaera borealis]QOV88854.1 dihydrodipicolinate synthase family protein [Humisphaera borealis]